MIGGEVSGVSVSPGGWKTAIVGLLVNDDFAAWARGEGVWELRSTDVLRALWFRWRPLAACRTRDDAEATLAMLLEQMASEKGSDAK